MNEVRFADAKRVELAVKDFERAVKQDWASGHTVTRKLEIRIKKGRIEHVFTEGRREYTGNDDPGTSTGTARE